MAALYGEQIVRRALRIREMRADMEPFTCRRLTMVVLLPRPDIPDDVADSADKDAHLIPDLRPMGNRAWPMLSL